MATPPISFSGSDYTAELERLITRARELLTEWTDLNYSDPLVVVLALQATTTDMCRLVVDNYAQEQSIHWARFRQSLIDMAKLGDYLPTLASAASTPMGLTRKAGITGPIIIPKWTPFARSDGLEYLAVTSAAMPATADYLQINAIEGVLVTRTLRADDFTVIDWSRRPRYNLGANVAAGTVSLSHNNGDTAWREVETLFEVGPNDYVFMLELNGDDDTVWLTLGNGNRGAGPVNQDMTLQFVRTNATRGNCGANTITIAPETHKDLLTCSNVSIATGGAPSETREQLRESIPDRFSIQRRAVTPPDYERVVKDVPGILHCRAFDRNTSREWPHMTVGLFVVPEGGGPMTAYHKELIWAALADKGELGDWPERYTLRDAVEKPVQFILRVGLSPGGQSEVVLAAMTSALQSFMAPEKQAIGAPVRFSALHSLVSAIPNVSWVEFDAPLTDVVPAVDEIPVFGSVQVIFG